MILTVLDHIRPEHLSVKSDICIFCCSFLNDPTLGFHHKDTKSQRLIFFNFFLLCLGVLVTWW